MPLYISSGIKPPFITTILRHIVLSAFYVKLDLNYLIFKNDIFCARYTHSEVTT